MGKLSDQELIQVRESLAQLLIELIHAGQVLPVITDTGASQTCGGQESAFVPGSLKALPAPISMDGVAGSLQAAHSRLFDLETTNDIKGITIIQISSLFVPGIDCILLSPQDLLGELWEQEGEDG